MPGRVVLDEDVDMAIISTPDGDVGVLPNHEQASIVLRDGPLRIRKGAENVVALTVLGGFATVRRGALNVTTPFADTPERIDQAIAALAREREQNKIYEQTANMETNRAEAAIRHILVRREGSTFTILRDRPGRRGGADERNV